MYGALYVPRQSLFGLQLWLGLGAQPWVGGTYTCSYRTGLNMCPASQLPSSPTHPVRHKHAMHASSKHQAVMQKIKFSAVLVQAAAALDEFLRSNVASAGCVCTTTTGPRWVVPRMTSLGRGCWTQNAQTALFSPSPSSATRWLFFCSSLSRAWIYKFLASWRGMGNLGRLITVLLQLWALSIVSDQVHDQHHSGACRATAS